MSTKKMSHRVLDSLPDLPDEKTIAKMRLKISICATRWHGLLVNSLTQLTIDELVTLGVNRGDIMIHHVPGCWELPYISEAILKNDRPDAVMCVGILLQGETGHFEQVNNAVCAELMRIQHHTRVPIINSILACYSMAQARARTTGKLSRSIAKSFALTAVQMGIHKRHFSKNYIN